MSYETIAEIIMDAERRAVLAGVPAAEARTILMKAEAALVNAMANSDRRDRQFLLDLKEHGANVLAGRFGVSRAQVYVMRNRVLNKVSKNSGAV
ncbi:hypothetical protein CH75_04805 [Dyella jiangningensis]|nr:hypothetical protein CH75_04805 [Dyella jiangningensis]